MANVINVVIQSMLLLIMAITLMGSDSPHMFVVLCTGFIAGVWFMSVLKTIAG